MQDFHFVEQETAENIATGNFFTVVIYQFGYYYLSNYVEFIQGNIHVRTVIYDGLYSAAYCQGAQELYRVDNQADFRSSLTALSDFINESPSFLSSGLPPWKVHPPHRVN